MLNRRAVDAFLGEDEVPRLRPARCVRRRDASNACRACLLACPHQVLWFGADGTWRLHAAACDGCGACASACPSQAIDAPGIDGRALRRAWRDADVVTLGCSEGRADASVRLPCLAGLHPERLATALLRRPSTPVRLDMSACGGCAKRALRGVIRAQVSRALRYVRALGVVPDVRVVDGGVSDEGGGAGAARPLSRRDLFQLARTRGSDLVARGLAAGDGVDPGAALPHRAGLLAAARERFVALGAPARGLPLPGAFFVDWEVTDACDGCRAAEGPRCVGACPNGAWRLGGAGTESVLSHDAARCSACGACTLACPQAALEARPAPVTADAGRLAKRRFPRSRCRACRQRAARGADGLCNNCRKRRGLLTSLPPRGAPTAS